MAESSSMHEAIDRVAHDSGFSGVVRVDRDGRTVAARAYGHADRRHRILNTVTTRFAVASGTKALTALTIMSLVADDTLSLDTPARSLLGADLPLIHDDVTIEHLLGHRSGIGDYLDESIDMDADDYLMTVPVHTLISPEDYLGSLDGFPQREQPDAAFRYNNSGYVVLALIAERVAGRPFHDLVTERVLEPAGMRSTAFLRSDELPPDAAVGYLRTEGLRTNVLHLPVVGSGDGGVYTTAADVHALWRGLFADEVVPRELRELMIAPRSDAPVQGMRYGLGFWLHPTGPALALEGSDAGVSFRTVHDPASGTSHTTLSNTSSGAWPVSAALDDALGLS